MRCTVFIATSLDGFIARPDGRLDWLPGNDGYDPSEPGPSPDEDPSGYAELMTRVDVLVMGRATFDTVLGFGIGWPYALPVVVLTSRPLEAPGGADVRVEHGPVVDVLARLEAGGFTHAYVDGGAVVQQALAADVVDEVTVTTVPVLLGDGIRLFGPLPGDLWFTPDAPRSLPDGMTQTTWWRDRSR